MIFPEHIFKANDIRGLLPEITEDLARAAGYALVKKTGAKMVVVGRDMRETSEALAAAAIDGITAAGADVKDIGLATTSLFNFAVSHYSDIDAGVMVTASHNPAEYNGLKFADATGLPISGTDMRNVIAVEVAPVATVGQTRQWSVVDDYVEACVAGVGRGAAKGLRAVVDYGNGMGSVVFRKVAAALELEIDELYPEPDARFPNHEANPVKREALKDIEERLRAGGYDLGIAFDGDADRVGFLDNLARPLRGDQILALLVADVLKDKPGAKVIVQPSHTWATREAIERGGGVPVEVTVGRTKVVAAMRSEDAVLGGEVSCHYFFKEFAGLEAVDHAVARMCHLIKVSGRPFADLTESLFGYHNSWEVNIEVKYKDAVLAAIEAAYAPMATKVNKLDGLRCDFGHDWWFLVRASNTEPLLRLIVEAREKALFDQKLAELTQLMHSA